MSTPDRIFVVRVMRDVLVRASEEETGWQALNGTLEVRPGATLEERVAQWRCGDLDLEEVLDIHPLRTDGTVDPLTIRELLASGGVSTQALPDEDGVFRV